LNYPDGRANPFTADNLDAVLTVLENDGFSFVSLADQSVFPLLNGLSLADMPWIGSTCDEPSDCELGSGGSDGFCLIQGFCTQTCEGTCPDRLGWAPTFCIESQLGGSGICVPQAHPLNDPCSDVPGTVPELRQRFIGNSGSSACERRVCAPY